MSRWIDGKWLLNFFVELPDDYTLTIGNLRAVINDAPSVVPSRAEGEWVISDIQLQEDNDNGNYAYVCTNCKHTDIHAKTQKVPYCWWCGAKMK